jgi:hypothetical protein
MNIFFSTVLLALVLGGLLYYWQKARLLGVHWLYMVLAFLCWPIGALIGAYWAISDFYFYYRGKPLITSKQNDKDSKYSLKD